MEPFIKNHQYNVIADQAKALINGHTSVVDTAVLNALESMALEKVMGLFSDLTEEQKQLLTPIVHVTGKEEAVGFLSRVKPFVLPFPHITEQNLNKLFPKAKKMKGPRMESVNLKEISYLSWIEKGTSKKYLVAEQDEVLVGLEGTFTSLNQKGICTLCHSQEDVGLFVATAAGENRDTFINRGNYICKDSKVCNQNITDLDNLDQFIGRLKSRTY